MCERGLLAIVVIVISTTLTTSSHSLLIDDEIVEQWCKKLHDPVSNPPPHAFHFARIVQRLNESLKSAVQLEELSRLYNRTDSFSSNQTEAAFAAVCRQLYKQMKHLPNSKSFYSGFIHSILNIRPKVWAASLIAILVISMVGLLGVSVVPLVQKVFFNEVIQYLVAVAVGTLTGDAMLHLIPHAISVDGHDHETPGERQSDTEKMSVYKGLVALGGVYFFFMAEKTLGFVSEYRAEKKLEEEDRKRAMEHPRRHTDVRRLSAFRPSLIPGTLGVPGQQRRISQLDPSVCRRASRALSLVNEDIMTTGLTSKAMRSIDILYRYAEEDAQKDEQISEPGTDDEGTTTIHLPVPTEIARLLDGSDTSLSSKKNDTSLRVPKILFAVDQGEDHTSEHFAKDEKKPAEPNEGNDSERKHGHGHSHKVPGSVASVAWMVILGDGLHNFTDGMAIGASFAQSISGGLSTAVAVFCHELPHELGDFAVLLKTGMRIKEALFFNVVSSILSLFGMFAGIALGNVASASQWIFAVTAGTFIYIALVDMLPELSGAELRPGQTRIGQVVLQSTGLFTGVGIMLCIALFEEKIKLFVD